jgi:Lysylphosphatidylglycerol synthase TM region
VKRLLVAGSSVAAAAMLAYSIHLLGAAGIRDALGRIGWGFFAIFALSGLREASRAFAWTLTLDNGARLPVRKAFQARLVGEALNSLLPMGFLIGEPAKAEYVADHLPFATAFGALMIEFAFYSASLLLLFAVGAASVLSPAALITIGLLLAPAFAVLTRAQRLLRPLLDFGRRQPGRVWEILSLEVLYHALGIAEGYLILWFISPQRPTLASAVLLETVGRGVAIAFKMLPMRIGVDEASAAFVANRLALGTTTGLTLALVRKLRALFWSVVGLGLMAVRAVKHSACFRTSSVTRTPEQRPEIEGPWAVRSLL